MINQTTTYKSNLMQRMLGRHYKWWYMLLLGYKSNTTYRFNSLAWLLNSVVLVLGTLIVWYINYNQTGILADGFKEIFTYFVIGEGLIFASAIQFDIGEAIQNGKFTSKLLLPVSYLKAYFFLNFGYQLFENISKLIIYLFLALIFINQLILPTLLNFSIFLILIIIAYLLNTLIGIIIGGSAFYFTSFFGAASLMDSIRLIFGGRLFPLDRLSILQPLLYSPFAFTFYHPMQIYLGKYDTNQTLLVFAGGIAWCIILYLLAKLVFKLGLKKNEAVGL